MKTELEKAIKKIRNKLKITTDEKEKVLRRQELKKLKSQHVSKE